MRQRLGLSTLGIIGGLLVLLMVATAACDDPQPTATSEPTKTLTPTSTYTPTERPTLTPTGTPMPTSSLTPAPTNTPAIDPTATPTPERNPTPTGIPTATPTPPQTPSPTPTATPTPTNTPSPVPQVDLVLEAEADLVGYWSDGTADVAVTLLLRDDGGRPLEGVQRIAVTCRMDDAVVTGCQDMVAVKLPDGFGPAARCGADATLELDEGV